MTSTSAAVATRRAAPGPSPLEAALTDQVLDAVYKFAFRKTRHEEDAEDLAQQALELALRRDGTDSAWLGEPPPVVMFLGSVLNGDLANQRRTGKRRPKLVAGEAEDAPSETPTIEQAAVEREEENDEHAARAAMKAELRTYFEARDNGRIPLAILDAAREGVTKRSVLIERIGCSPDELDNARDRLRDQGERIVERRRKGRAPS